jgi:uncharacterized iron-regulated membrane protein
MSATWGRRWWLVHRWTSLVCTLFLLLLCVTGLPLVFGEEIGGWLDDSPPYAPVLADMPAASLDGIVAQAQHRHPNELVMSIFVDDDEPQVLVFMVPSWQAFRADPKVRHRLKFDSRTGALLDGDDRSDRRRTRFLELMLGLHRDLLAGLSGELLLGAMALCFVTSLVSGAMLYGRFMRRLRFGTVRMHRAPRLRWLDLHNLLGAVALAWMVVVGATGTINELSTPLFGLWQKTDVQFMLQRWQGRPIPGADELSSIEAAFRAARSALPRMHVVSLFYPGSPFGTPSHYLLWAKGGTPLTSRLFSPVLVDARTGELTAVVQMPWYLRALEVSRPLHFGDYGGLPLKVIWALLDIATIMVLGSGLYLWLSRRKSPIEARLAELEDIASEA